MGSVLSEIKCPECGYENACIDFYYKSGEEYVWCNRCGYYSSWTIRENRIGNKSLKRTDFVEEIKKGIGRWCVMFKGGGTSGVILSRIQKVEFEKDYSSGNMKNIDGDKPTEVFYTFYNEEKEEWYIRDLIKNEDYPFKDKYKIDEEKMEVTQ